MKGFPCRITLVTKVFDNLLFCVCHMTKPLVSSFRMSNPLQHSKPLYLCSAFWKLTKSTAIQPTWKSCFTISHVNDHRSDRRNMAKWWELNEAKSKSIVPLQMLNLCPILLEKQFTHEEWIIWWECIFFLPMYNHTSFKSNL